MSSATRWLDALVIGIGVSPLSGLTAQHDLKFCRREYSEAPRVELHE